jgi:hypothetical protein
LKIERQGQLKKHLGIWYSWKKDKTGKTYLEAHMPNMVKEICEKYHQTTGKRSKKFSTPGAPGKTLKKIEGKMRDIESYCSKDYESCNKDCTPYLQCSKRVSLSLIQPWRRALEGFREIFRILRHGRKISIDLPEHWY